MIVSESKLIGIFVRKKNICLFFSACVFMNSNFILLQVYVTYNVTYFHSSSFQVEMDLNYNP